MKIIFVTFDHTYDITDIKYGRKMTMVVMCILIKKINRRPSKYSLGSGWKKFQSRQTVAKVVFVLVLWGERTLRKMRILHNWAHDCTSQK